MEWRIKHCLPLPTPGIANLDAKLDHSLPLKIHPCFVLPSYPLRPLTWSCSLASGAEEKLFASCVGHYDLPGRGMNGSANQVTVCGGSEGKGDVANMCCLFCQGSDWPRGCFSDWRSRDSRPTDRPRTGGHCLMGACDKPRAAEGTLARARNRSHEASLLNLNH